LPPFYVVTAKGKRRSKRHGVRVEEGRFAFGNLRRHETFARYFAWSLMKGEESNDFRRA
jgi:hypothetical protein